MREGNPLSSAITAAIRVYQNLKDEDERLDFAWFLHDKIYTDRESGCSRERSIQRLEDHVDDWQQKRLQDQEGNLEDRPIPITAEAAEKDAREA